MKPFSVEEDPTSIVYEKLVAAKRELSETREVLAEAMELITSLVPIEQSCQQGWFQRRQAFLDKRKPCNCPPDRCLARKVMGVQMPCLKKTQEKKEQKT